MTIKTGVFRTYCLIMLLFNQKRLTLVFDLFSNTSYIFIFPAGMDRSTFSLSFVVLLIFLRLDARIGTIRYHILVFQTTNFVMEASVVLLIFLRLDARIGTIRYHILVFQTTNFVMEASVEIHLN